jgi:hypothetical protein
VGQQAQQSYASAAAELGLANEQRPLVLDSAVSMVVVNLAGCMDRKPYPRS